MPIIAQNERKLYRIITKEMDKDIFIEYLHDLDDETIPHVMQTIRKYHLLKMPLPSYLDLLSEREEKVIDSLVQKNYRHSMWKLYNALDDWAAKTLFLLWFRAEVQHFIAKEYQWPESPPSTFKPDDFTPSP